MSESNSDKNNDVAVTKMLDPSGPLDTLKPDPKAEAQNLNPDMDTLKGKPKAESLNANSKAESIKTNYEVETTKTSKLKKITKVKTTSAKLVHLDPPKLSTYIDFRIFLADFLKYKQSLKLGIRKYSASDFAAAADLKSPQYLKLVIDRQRNLSEDGVHKFCKALGLNKEDSTEFLYLVFYNQATQPNERYQYLQKLSEHRAKSVEGIKTPHWLKVILYSICEGMGGEYTIDDFKNLLGDKCKLNELNDCLQELVKENALMVNPTADGKVLYKKTTGQNTLSNDIPIDIIKKIQSDLLLLALESLFSDSPKDRDLGSFSIALTAKEFEETKFEIRKFRKALLKNLLMKREQSSGEKVYQVQFQIFPVTKGLKDI